MSRLSLRCSIHDGGKMEAKGLRTKTRIYPVEVLFVGVLLLWLFVPTTERDDNWFLATYILNFGENLPAFLKFRYETWSTRLILEAYTLFLLKYPLLYKLSMAAWVVAVVTGLRRLLGHKGNETVLWAMCAWVGVIPMDIHLRAGYVCTTVNYVFAMACIIWAAVPVLARLRGEKPPLWQEVLALVLMVLGCNMEYYCPPALIAFLVLSVKTAVKKKNPWLSIVLTVIAAASLWFALAAPSGTLSSYNDATQYFPGYEDLSVLQKLQAAFVSTAGGMISTYCHGDEFFLGSLLFGVVLGLWGLEKEKTRLRWLYLIPGVMTLGIGLACRMAPRGSGFAAVFYDGEGGWLWHNGWAFWAAAVYFGVTLYCLWRSDRRLCGALALVLFCRVTMGASRSLFDSGLRTFYPMFYVYGGATAVLLAGMEKWRKVGWVTLLATSGIMLSVNIYQLFM